MAIYVYKTADGALVSWCPNDTDPVADTEHLAENGLTAIAGLSPLDDTHVWSEAAKTVVAASAPALPNIVATGEWLMRFTPAEFEAVTSSQDAVVKQVVYALNHTVEIDLNSALIQQGVGYLAQLGLIQQARAAIILG